MTAPLPELAAVWWRQPASADSLRRRARLWTLSVVLQTTPLVAAGALLLALNALTAPVALAALAHAWIIPELYAHRGAGVVRRSATRTEAGPEQRALGLLGDLLGHNERELERRTGLALERGELGVWLLAGGGALLVTPGGRRVHCLCVKASGAELPRGDRIAHLLLALRSDEHGFATVANQAFVGATWRLRRRLPRAARPALDCARALAREQGR